MNKGIKEKKRRSKRGKKRCKKGEEKEVRVGILESTRNATPVKDIDANTRQMVLSWCHISIE